MKLRTEHEGKVYEYTEKGERACLVNVTDDRLLFWGCPNSLVPCGIAPIAVLLTFSILRKHGLAS